MSGVAVSVVVPAYNPGDDIEPRIASLLDQSMPPERLELIFVDDGSTDGTAERLDQLAAGHPHVRVIHEPNSGWAGRPRNVGTDAAHGEFVQYVDQDDELGPKALERLYEFGVTNAADIVIGKVSSDFRQVPHDLWRVNVDKCSIHTHPLISSLTPHKMFRSEFLRRTGIRFPEGRRRLEDQVFMVAAYFATDAVAILGDYPCYYYKRRSEGDNSGAADVDPAGYYNNLREVLDLVEANTEPGEFRDALRARFLQPIVRRVSGVATDATLPPGYAESLIAQARALVIERFPQQVRDRLPVMRLRRIEALIEGDLDHLRAVSEEAAAVRAVADVLDVRPTANGWTLAISAGLRDGDGAVFGAAPVSGDAAQASVYVRERRRGVEWFAPDGLTAHIVPIPDASNGASAITFEGDVDVLPRLLAGGRALGNGTWLLGIRLHAHGLTRTARIKLPDDPQLDAVPLKGRQSLATLNAGGIVTDRPAQPPA